MKTATEKTTDRGTCLVCKRSFKLVGINPPVLARHGFKGSIYGHGRPCLGAGFTADHSLVGAIQSVERSITWDKSREGFEWRAEQNVKVLAWLKTL